MIIVSWNIARRKPPWETLLEMKADVALLQEARQPAVDLPARVEIDPSPWHTASPGRAPGKQRSSSCPTVCRWIGSKANP